MVKNINNQIKIIINYFNSGNFNKVFELSNNILKNDPENDFILNLVGLSYQKLQNFHKAEDFFVKAIRINKKNINAATNIANNYKYILNYKKSEEYYKFALNINSNHIIALINFGNLKFLTTKYDEALNLLKKAEILNNTLIPTQINLAIVYQSLGNFEEAINCLERINKLDPTFTRADKMKSMLINYNEQTDHLEEMKQKIKKLDLTDAQKIYLFFAISKAYEDKKNYKEAFHYMKRGNDLKYKISNQHTELELEKSKKIKKIFTNYKFVKSSIKTIEKIPIFIIGLPRSGTSLIEQIVSAHSQVTGLGEINIFNNITNNEFLEKQSYNNFNINLVNTSNIKKEYTEIIECFDLKTNFFTDKTLLNFNWIGMIKLCFPNAKIIHCKRNNKDNLLSIYKNLFDHEGSWCYNEKALVEYYKNYIDIMMFWKKLFNEEIYDIEYEELIKNPKPNIESLLKFCNLKWDDKCLDFKNNKSAINTLSVKQARNGLYNTSINSFSNYVNLDNQLFKEL
jgi:tetratricopeptide (TPR) repeat protein